VGGPLVSWHVEALTPKQIPEEVSIASEVCILKAYAPRRFVGATADHDRSGDGVRYSLIVSAETPGPGRRRLDPVAADVGIPIEIQT
jgi:hypothetical protein